MSCQSKSQDRTAIAIRLSIRHWKANAKASKPSDARIGGQHCALCAHDAFLRDKDHELRKAEESPEYPKPYGVGKKSRCSLCPVAMETGAANCARTPYVAASYALEEWRFREDNPDSKLGWQSAAQAEVRFLGEVLVWHLNRNKKAGK